MTEETYNIIETLLYDTFAQMNASFLHVNHQLGLPAKYRIEVGSEADMRLLCRDLKVSMNRIENTIAELKADKDKFVYDQPNHTESQEVL